MNPAELVPALAGGATLGLPPPLLGDDAAPWQAAATMTMAVSPTRSRLRLNPLIIPSLLLDRGGLIWPRRRKDRSSGA